MTIFRFTFLPVHLAVLAILLNNWTFGQTAVNFSDPLLIIGLVLLLLNSPRITKMQMLVFLTIQLVVGVNVFLATMLTASFSTANGLLYFIKVSLYALFVILLYNFVLKHQIARDSLGVLVFWAVVASLIGLYISFVLQTKIGLPYEFFWEFTRQDVNSYTSGGSTGVIRTRSIFAEPQHLGMFLNTVILFALFNSVGYKAGKLSIIILVATAITTYSFSTVPITVILLLAFALKKFGIGIFATFCVVFGAVLVAGGSAFFSDSLRITMLQRYNLIVSGDDTSANARIYGSWEYFNPDNFLIGNGIGSSPSIFNNYAYVLTELGIFPLILLILLTIFILKRNLYFGLFFIALTYTKGGYLSAYYCVMLTFFFIYSLYLKPEICNESEDINSFQTGKKVIHK